MSKKNKIIFITFLVVLGLLILFLVLRGKGKAPTQTVATNNGESSAQKEEVPAAPPPTAVEVKQLTLENQLLAIARTFTERYGSFSNQGGFLNLLDLEPIVTISLWHDLEDSHNEQKNLASKEYFGITTRALSLKILETDENSARISAQTQREEGRGSPPVKRVYYEELELSLVNSGGRWLVESSRWK